MTMFSQNLEAKSRRLKYDAVSYHWGDPAKVCPVTVNGETFFITTNLFAALKHLRQPDMEISLWIDSICINQLNTKERTQQVTQMGKIYSTAACVRIWLGNESDDSSVAMRLVNDPIRIDEASGIALTKLLRRPYWQRMWVFQEIILARHGIVHCGSAVAPWTKFKALDHMAAIEHLWLRVQSQAPWAINLRKALFGIAQFSIPRSEAQHLANVLVPTRHMQATDPRDKIFALLGLCADHGGLVFDYTKPVWEVFVDFTVRQLKSTMELSLLLTAGIWNPKNGPNMKLPSWTPDYRGIHGVDLRYVAGSFLQHFCAAGKREAFALNQDFYQRCVSTGILVAQGLIIDTINRSLPLEQSSTSRRGIYKAFDPSNLGPHPRRTAQIQVLFRTLVFYNATFTNGVTKESIRFKRDRLRRLTLGFVQDVEKLEAGYDICEALDSLGPVAAALQTGEYPALLSEYPALKGEYLTLTKELRTWYRQEFLNRCHEATSGVQSTVFSTVRSFLGQGPGNARTGDVVAILFGCRVPLVLRQTGSQFRLIGPCYVDGINHGEEMRAMAKNGSKPREIEIV